MKLSQKVSLSFAMLCGAASIGLNLADGFLFFVVPQLEAFVYLLIGSSPSSTAPNHVLSFLCYAAVLMIPSALCCGALSYALRGQTSRTKRLLACATVLTAVPLAALLLPLMMHSIWAVVFTAVGGFGCIIGLWIYDKLKTVCPAVFNYETMSYIIFGVLTTVVSFVSQMLFASLGTPTWVNTVGSWICAVAFAYVVNKLFVFKSHTDSAKAFFRELWLFFAARLASLGMELVFMIVTVDLLHFSEAVCKLIAQIFILIANYVFSKLIIFNKKGNE